MDDRNSASVVADEMVVSLDYTLTVEGQTVDSSRETEPIEFLQGYGNIIPGLEKELYGMAPGDSKQITVAAKDGYGERDPEAVIDVPRSEFPADIPLTPGVELQMQNVDGDVLTAVILEAGTESVKLDFNHPLAGRDLHFDVTVIALRPATEEEIEHGHVHGEGHEFEDEYDEDFDEDFDDEIEIDEDGNGHRTDD
ncbi:MAG TPA: peptidylprolyl isomerase [Anaerolineaceae bacterium]|nr:peptidylprolyl isomerase [Anaerolineaceae bacterium]